MNHLMPSSLAMTMAGNGSLLPLSAEVVRTATEKKSLEYFH